MPPRLTSWMRIVIMVVMRSPGSGGECFCSAVAVSAVNPTKGWGWIAGRVQHQTLTPAADTGEPGLAGACPERRSVDRAVGVEPPARQPASALAAPRRPDPAVTTSDSRRFSTDGAVRAGTAAACPARGVDHHDHPRRATDDHRDGPVPRRTAAGHPRHRSDPNRSPRCLVPPQPTGQPCSHRPAIEHRDLGAPPRQPAGPPAPGAFRLPRGGQAATRRRQVAASRGRPGVG
jgi:hypothetical protein